MEGTAHDRRLQQFVMIVAITILALRLTARGARAVEQNAIDSPLETLRHIVESYDTRLARSVILAPDCVHEFQARHDRLPIFVFHDVLPGQRPNSVRENCICFQSQMMALLFPRTIKICYGGVPGIDALLDTIDFPFYLLNLTPASPAPAQNRMRPLTHTPEYALWFYDGGTR